MITQKIFEKIGLKKPKYYLQASVVVTLTTFFCMLIGMLILNNLHMQTDFATARTTTRRPTPMLHRGDSGYRGKNG